MNNAPGGVEAETRRRLDQERSLVESAIAMVAARGSTRVTVAGIRFGEELLPDAERLTRGKGVKVHPIWGLGDGVCDIVVEADDVVPGADD